MPGASWDAATETLTVSQSWLNTYRDCPEQARRVLTGEVIDYPGPAALVGIFAHGAIASVIRNNLEVDAAKLIACIEAEADIETDSGNPNVTEDCVQNAVVALQSWYESDALTYLSLMKNPEAEVMFDAELAPGIRIRGSSDVRHDDGLADWKFPADMQSWRKEWEKQRYAIQPTVYLALLDRLDKQFDFYVCSWANFDNKIIPVHRNIADVQALIRECIAIRNQVQRQGLDGPWALRPTDWHCSPAWCPAYTDCLGHHEEAAIVYPQWVEKMISDRRTSSDGNFSYPEWAAAQLQQKANNHAS